MKVSPEIIGTYTSRSQSPAAETTMQVLIYDALQALMEESYLYRSRRIDITEIERMFPTSLPLARAEFQHRPWVPHSQNQGYTAMESQIMRMPKGQPLGIPSRGMSLGFVIPTIKTWCYKCERFSVHDSIPHIECSPYHLNPEKVAEPEGIQNFIFNMRCQECKSPPITFMIRRELLKVQLCGRNHPFLAEAPDEIPVFVRKIYKDAVGAAACQDIFGAFYHLRTLLEHYIKQEIGMPIDERIDGDELCRRYNERVDVILAQRASLKPLFETCSASLHNRTGTLADYEKAKQAICTHFQLKRTLQKLS